MIQGTLELETLVSAIRDAYLEDNPSAQVQIDPGGGLRAGFDALCAGDVDIVMSNEPITDLQIQACANAGTDFIETAIAYEAVVFLASTAADVQCVSQETLNTIWQLGAAEEVTWDGDLTSPALTGPVSRGDWDTVRRHLTALPEQERSAYVAMADQAARLAGRVLPWQG